MGAIMFYEPTMGIMGPISVEERNKRRFDEVVNSLCEVVGAGPAEYRGAITEDERDIHHWTVPRHEEPRLWLGVWPSVLLNDNATDRAIDRLRAHGIEQIVRLADEGYGAVVTAEGIAGYDRVRWTGSPGSSATEDV